MSEFTEEQVMALCGKPLYELTTQEILAVVDHLARHNISHQTSPVGAQAVLRVLEHVHALEANVASLEAILDEASCSDTPVTQAPGAPGVQCTGAMDHHAVERSLQGITIHANKVAVGELVYVVDGACNTSDATSVQCTETPVAQPSETPEHLRHYAVGAEWTSGEVAVIKTPAHKDTETPGVQCTETPVHQYTGTLTPDVAYTRVNDRVPVTITQGHYVGPGVVGIRLLR